MNFAKVFFFVFALFLAMSTVSAAPKWKIFKKLEKVGRNVRDGIIKAAPAVQTIGQAATIYRGGK
ncbi:cecropin-like [Ostrinia furnacalis]|uniref:cecropin-like n=1 Tax=Ostrinia furnacalis TaxID=93504 RepID=UPI0010406FD7|nr:cecropin-like [Ostrinia furnacalis]